MQSVFTPSTSANCRRNTTKQRQHYGSVKYNKLAEQSSASNTISAKEKFFGKQIVHHTQSSPLNSGPLRAAYGSSNNFIYCNNHHTIGYSMSSTSTVDRKVSSTSNSSRLLVHENSLERRLLSPNKLPINGGVGNGALPQTLASSRNRVIGDRQKQKLMALAPPSLHISFDAAEPEHRRAEHHLMPVSLSSDNFRGYRHSIAIPRHQSPSPLRRDIQKQKQRLLEGSDFAEISSEYLRINGFVQPFKVTLFNLVLFLG